MIERITQSFMKTMREYLAGDECGHLVKRQYVDGILVDRTSDAMSEGSYFEYILTGGLPKSGIVPEPVYMATPLKKKKPEELTVEDMTAEYRRAHANADYVKQYFKLLGWKILRAGVKKTKGRFEGTIDIEVEVQTKMVLDDGTVLKKGDVITVDLKYSGLIEDKWSKHGWMWADIQKQYHGTQAKQYHFIAGGRPFFFVVVSNTNKEIDGEKMKFPPPLIKIFYVPIDEHMTEAHINEGNMLFDQLKIQSKLGLTPRPSFNRCNVCPLRSDCSDREEYPKPETVDLTIY